MIYVSVDITFILHVSICIICVYTKYILPLWRLQSECHNSNAELPQFGRNQMEMIRFLRSNKHHNYICETNSSQGKRDSMWIEPSIFGVSYHYFHYLFHVIFTKNVHHKKRCTQSITHSKPLSMTNLPNWKKTSQNCWTFLGAILIRIRSRPDHQHLPACAGLAVGMG